MPVVEAMACGTPVVASSHSSLDEACGDAAVRVDPLDAEAIAAGIREALERRDELVAAGLEHAASVLLARDGGGRAPRVRGARVNVGLDVAPLVQDAAGTARWIRGLLGELERREDVAVRRLGWGGPGRLTAVVRDLVWYPILLPRQARRAGLDVLHCTIYRAPTRSRVPVVVTVHDLAVLRQPEVFPAWTRLYGSTLLRRDDPHGSARRRGLRVLAPRDRRAVRRRPRPDRRRPECRRRRLRRRGPARGGRLRARRRHARAAQEPRRARSRRPASRGSSSGSSAPRAGAAWTDGAGVTWLGRLSDDELARLYRGARCLVYPSLYEGFGIPVAEAMASGTPVVTSRDSAMADVAGAAAVLVDPLDPRSIADGIGEASASPRRACPARARARASSTPGRGPRTPPWPPTAGGA